MVVFLASCSSIYEKQEFVVVHDMQEVGDFKELWSGCGSLYFSTSDNKWLVSIKVPDMPGIQPAKGNIELIDFSKFKNRECAISLYKNNDIGCGEGPPPYVYATKGEMDVGLKYKQSKAQLYATITAHDIAFNYRDKVLKISKVFIPSTKLSEFCGG